MEISSLEGKKAYENVRKYLLPVQYAAISACTRQYEKRGARLLSKSLYQT